MNKSMWKEQRKARRIHEQVSAWKHGLCPGSDLSCHLGLFVRWRNAPDLDCVVREQDLNFVLLIFGNLQEAGTSLWVEQMVNFETAAYREFRVI